MKSYITNGHYMFGNTFIQPEMPMYNNIHCHSMANTYRAIPPYPDVECHNCTCNCNYLGYENDGTKVDVPYNDNTNNNNCNCTECPNDIIRDPLMYNVINIETSVIRTLKIKLYGINPSDDKIIEMNIGKRYAVTYITEHGMVTSVGYLETVSNNIPDECIRYINSNNISIASTAYIGMDCSKEGHSDKRKIYISSIRYIQDLNESEDEAEIIETKSMKTRLQELLDAIDKGELVFCKNNCSNIEHNSNATNESETGSPDIIP